MREAPSTDETAEQATGHRWQAPPGAASSLIIAIVVMPILLWGATLFLGRLVSP